MDNTDLAGQTVSVIGLGLMGSALARAFLVKNHQVTVWNRTASKCEPLAQEGARIAESVAAAAVASQVVVVSLLDFIASSTLLRTAEVAANLKGKTLVQMTTGTAFEVREEAAWAKQQGIAYLRGVIFSFPQGIGAPECTIAYAGPKNVFEAHRSLLFSLGENSRFLGESIEHGSVLSAGMTAYLGGTILGYLHGAAICDAEGVALDTYAHLSSAFWNMPATADVMQTMVEKIQKGNYATTQGTVEMFVTLVRDEIRYLRTRGVDCTYHEGILAYFQRAMDQGHGQHDAAAVFESIRNKAGRLPS